MKEQNIQYIYTIGMFTWAVGLPVYWHIHSVVCGLHSIPPLPAVSARAGMIGPCSLHPVGAKILLLDKLLKCATASSM